MRFIRREQVVTTIFNKELSDEETIRNVFNNLFSHNIDFSMTMKKYMLHQQDYFNMSFEQVRVRAVNNDDTLDLLAIKNGIKTTMRNVAFSDIIEVNATTRKHKILDVDDDLTRWDILDL